MDNFASLDMKTKNVEKAIVMQGSVLCDIHVTVETSCKENSVPLVTFAPLITTLETQLTEKSLKILRGKLKNSKVLSSPKMLKSIL